MRRLTVHGHVRRPLGALADVLRPRRLRRAWRMLGTEQRAAAVGSGLLLLSTLGPFSWVEAAVALVALAVLVLLYGRAEGRGFHLPLGDGGWVAAAGVWCEVLILTRLPDRPAGQGLLAMACAGILVLAGWREHARRPADDLPTIETPLSGPRRQRAARDRRR